MEPRKIGIAISTRNRPHVLAKSLEYHYKFLPTNAKLVIVDDASDILLPAYKDSFANTCFLNKRIGVASVKNICLALLEGCDDIFLFDDDCYPTCPYWHLYYISSKLSHAAMTFGRKILKINKDFIEFEKPCGCMLYLTKECINTVGGFDTEFTGYGYEHVNLSDRIYNVGLTPARYIDIPESLSILHSMDRAREVKSSFTDLDREKIPINYKLYKEKFYSKDFIPYK